MPRKRKPAPKTSSSEEDDQEEQHFISNDPSKPQADDDEDEEESEQDEDDDEDGAEDDEEESEEGQEEEENDKEQDDDDEEEKVEQEQEEDFSTLDAIRKLLEPFGKDQLIELLKESARKNPSLISQISQSAESDPIHRKLFVFGLGWDATSETLSSAFSQYGDIEECRVVTDRVTGRSKGYGFVQFKTRSATRKALKEPQKVIGGRSASCQLASFGAPKGGSNAVPEPTGRKIFVSNIGPSVNPERLRAFFAKFGEIEEGPLGYDRATGKLRGFAIFIYKTVEGCKKALEEPVKMFEGCGLQCNRALEGLKPKTAEPGVFGVPMATTPGVLQPNDLALAYGPGTLMGVNSAVGLVGQNLNPAGAGFQGQSLNPAGAVGLGATGFVGQNSSAAVGMMNPAVRLSSTVNGSSMTPTSYGIGSGVNSISPSVIGSYQGVNSISPSVIGSYQSQAALQGLGAYQNSQHSSGTHGMRSQPGSGLYGAGLPSYFGR